MVSERKAQLVEELPLLKEKMLNQNLQTEMARMPG
jgi:hypothetical protein